MNKDRIIGYNNSLAKGVTAMMLLFGLFVFSGYAAGGQSVHLQALRTEVAFSATQLAGRQTFLWQSLFTPAYSSRPIWCCSPAEVNAVLACNRLIKLKEEQLSGLRLRIKKVVAFLPGKTIPHDPDEFFLSHSRG